MLGEAWRKWWWMIWQSAKAVNKFEVGLLNRDKTGDTIHQCTNNHVCVTNLVPIYFYAIPILHLIDISPVIFFLKPVYLANVYTPHIAHKWRVWILDLHYSATTCPWDNPHKWPDRAIYDTHDNDQVQVLFQIEVEYGGVQKTSRKFPRAIVPENT